MEYPNVEYLFCHIPKTGGSSFSRLLKRKFMERSCYYNRKFNRLSEKTKCVFGHFRMSEMRPRFPNAKIITIIRNPVTQVISNYNHFLRLKRTIYPAGIGRLPLETTFDEFCVRMANYQSRFVDIPLEEVWYICDYEHLQRALQQLSLKGLTLEQNLPQLARYSHTYRPTAEETAKIISLNPYDFVLHQTAFQISEHCENE